MKLPVVTFFKQKTNRFLKRYEHCSGIIYYSGIRTAIDAHYAFDRVKAYQVNLLVKSSSSSFYWKSDHEGKETIKHYKTS